jgi:hypothetical protein
MRSGATQDAYCQRSSLHPQNVELSPEYENYSSDTTFMHVNGMTGTSFA